MSAGPLNTNAKAHKLVTEDKVRAALLKDKGPDAKYKSFNIVDFCTKGDNYACFVTSVEVDYQLGGEDKKVTYIAKLNHCLAMDSFEPFSTVLFEKEVNFYQKMVPSLNETLNNIGLPPIKFASSYFASLEPKSQVLLLGDKRKDSFKMADRFKGLDDDHVILVVKELARLHASSSIHEDNLGCEKFLEKHDYLEDFFTGARIKSLLPMFDDLFIQYVNNGAKIAERVVGYEKVAAWLKEIAPKCNDALSKEVSECDPKFRVVNHGDCWNNNLLFKYDDGKVTDVCLLDLQINRHASLALDLNYFLYTSLNGDTRKKGLTSYLTSYYDSFKEVFRAADKPMKFTLEELNKEFRNKNLFGLLMGLMVIPIVVMESTDVTDMSDVREDNMKEKMEEQQQKILDMVDTSPVLRPRLLDMFDEMVEHGTINLS
ncbi:EcKinase 4 [Hyalella azteca]|uniref:EcKinase 4 n=1 Tax=Hyalella azteca TaxID=294128 RepID=A0A6A0H5D6_HYAAZ|nr:EcKinase 4 [Hyalella azteca]